MHRWRRIIYISVLLGGVCGVFGARGAESVASSASSDDRPQTQNQRTLESIAQGYAIKDAQPLLSDFAAQSVQATVDSREWQHGLADAIAKTGVVQEIVGNHAGALHTINLHHGPEYAAQRAKVQLAIRDYIQRSVPKVARKFFVEQMLGGTFEKSPQDIEAVLSEISERATTSINDQLDELAGTMYDNFLEKFSACEDVQGVCPSRIITQVLTTDPSEWIEKNITAAQLGNVLVRPLSNAFGAGVVNNVRDRLDTALADQLPPEVVRMLHEGPDRVHAAAKWIDGHLPGVMLHSQIDKWWHRPLMHLPNPVYGAMLTASAARHYVQAFSGMIKPDLFELKRAQEITRVLIWQLANRDRIELSLADMASLATHLGKLMKLPPVAQWGRLGKNITQVQAKLRKIDAKMRAFDKYIKTHVDQADHEMTAAVKEVEDDLTDVQDTMLTPVHDIADTISDGELSLQNTLEEYLPDHALLPPTWDEAVQEYPELARLAGEYGEQSPIEKLRWDDDYEKMRKTLGDANEKIAKFIAEHATKILDRMGFTPLVARMLPGEKNPAQNPSRDNDFDPVLLHNGEFYHQITDFAQPARGSESLALVRTYRSRLDYSGPLGRNWSHNFAERLLFDDAPNAITWFDDGARKWIFTQEGVNEYRAPSGLFVELTRAHEQLLLRDADGVLRTFAGDGRLLSRCDRYQNCITLQYATVDHTLSRACADGAGCVEFFYDAVGRITRIRTPGGSQYHYQYDDADDLVQMTSCAETSIAENSACAHAPHTTYSYSRGDRESALNHNVLAIADQEHHLYLRNEYGARGLAFDRVITQYYGDRTVLRATYEMLRPAWLARGDDATLRVVVQRGARATEYLHNRAGQVVERTVRDAFHIYARTSNQYDDEERLRRSCDLHGLCRAWEYASKISSRFDLAQIQETRERAPDGENRRTRFGYVDHSQLPAWRENSVGVRMTWEYDASQRLRSIHLADGAVVRVATDAHGAITTLCPPTPRACITMTRDARGAPTQFAANGAWFERRTYSASGALATRALPGDERFSWVRDAFDRVTAVEHCAQHTCAPSQQFIYDALGNITQRFEGDANRFVARTDFSYDALDQLATTTQYADAHTPMRATFAYDDDGRVISERRGDGRTMHHHYDPLGRVVEIIIAGNDPSRAGPRWWPKARFRFDYDDAQHNVTVITPEQEWTRLYFNAFDELIAKELPQRWEIFTRDAAGRVTQTAAVDRNGAILTATRYMYDARDRVVEIARAQIASHNVDEVRVHLQPANADVSWISEQMRYNTDDTLAEMVSPLGARTQFTYDTLGRRTLQINPDNHRTAWTFDARGRVAQTHDLTTNAKWSFTYHPLGGMARATDPLGSVWQSTYDPWTHTLTQIDPTGRCRNITYDSLARPTQETRSCAGDDDSASAANIQYAWDSGSHLHTLTLGERSHVEYAYDIFDTLIARTEPDAPTWKRTTRSDGQTQEWRDADGRVQNFSYDAAGRLTQVSATAPEISSVQYEYERDALDHVISAHDANSAHAVRINFDSEGHELTSTRENFSITNVYDAAGELTAQIFPDGVAMQRTYDAVGRVMRVTSPQHTAWRAVSSDGLTETWQDGEHWRSERHFNLRGDITRIATFYDQRKMWEENYAYDAAGRVIDITSSSTPPRHFAYDARGALRDVADTAQAANAPEHQQPSAANATESAATRTRFITYDALQRVSNVALCAWYIARCTREKSVAQFPIDYDPLSRAVTVGAEQRWYAGWSVAATSNDVADATHSLAPTHAYTAYASADGLDTPLFAIAHDAERNDTRAFVRDAQENVRMMMTENNDQPIATCAYTPFGAPNDAAQCAQLGAFGFHGRPMLWSANLSDTRFRWLDTRNGNFLTPDPLDYKAPLVLPQQYTHGSRFHAGGLQDDDGFSLAAPKAAPLLIPPTESTLTAYAQGDPWRFDDPLGLWVTIAQNEENVQIHITAEVLASSVTPEFQQIVEEGMQKHWNKEFMRSEGQLPWNVTMNLDLHVVSQWQDPKAHRIFVEKLSADWAAGEVPFRGASVMSLAPETVAHNDSDVGDVFAHEVGHWLGLKDRYVKKKEGRGTPLPGYDQNLMGCSYCWGTTLNDQPGHDDIADILHRYPHRVNLGLRAYPNRYEIDRSKHRYKG